ncbi:hypothetical protein TI39_contig490g00006 [Zymoseptoria brevis]|uniref:Uncharacterized protein n=1 Tax=Zymoseptoria brevis TaxID=1047168 RepID=A0A0F4GMP4_9PEZI|nr:hypothetical protein TI39_contig490g00006 [Zymoseptoria brevis]
MSSDTPTRAPRRPGLIPLLHIATARRLAADSQEVPTVMPPRTPSPFHANQAHPPFHASITGGEDNNNTTIGDNAAEDDFSDDAEEFFYQFSPPPPPQTVLPYHGIERQRTVVLENGTLGSIPTLLLTTPDTSNSAEQINAEKCKGHVLDEHKRPRQGLVVTPNLTRRGSFRRGWRVHFDDETPQMVRHTPRPDTPRWAGDEREGMEALVLEEPVGGVDMDETEVEVTRVVVPKRDTPTARARAEAKSGTWMFRKKMVRDVEVAYASSPVHQTLAMMGAGLEVQTLDKGTQCGEDWEYET